MAVNHSLVLCLTALVLVGCESLPFSPFISPRVTGRVLAADTGRPLAGVAVRSGAQARGYHGAMPPKGGELLMAKSPVRTDGDGRFALDTERVLTPFRGTGWFSVQLLFERAGYESFRTNYSGLNLSTNAPEGESWLNAGDILLHPAAK
jgi:hypothetical protein